MEIQERKYFCDLCCDNEIDNENNLFSCFEDLNNHKLFSHPIKIIDSIFLGNMIQSSDYKALKSLGITHILNCATECKNHFENEFVYCKLELEDDQDFPIENYYEKAGEFFNEYNRSELKKKNLLIHCKLGRSRSAFFVLFYLIIFKNFNYNDALDKLLLAKPIACPNTGFQSKLKNLHNSLKLLYK